MNLEKENILQSCKSILHFLVNENDPAVRELKYKDFLHKFNEFEQPKNYSTTTKEKFDVIIFTVVKNELLALDQLFHFKREENFINEGINGINAWRSSIDRKNGFSNLTLLIVYICEVGPLECSMTTSRIFQKFECDFAILAGIAAGLEDKIKKYSVVVANSVVDYEPQRIGKDNHITFRPNHYDLDRKTKRDIGKLDLEDAEWSVHYQKAVTDYTTIDKSNLDLNLVLNAKIEIGAIASGNKLLADEVTLLALRENIPTGRGVIAAEMESGGFCIVCREFDKKWLVIRGISDYGGEDKNNEYNKVYQPIAAMAAFTATKYYLQNMYRKENEPGADLQEF